MEGLLRSEEWHSAVFDIRLDPVSFSRKIYSADSAENTSGLLGLLVSDILKALYSEAIPSSVKTHAVLLLSDECTVLFDEINSVDVAIVQLMDVYQKSGGESPAYRASVLTTITNIVLVHEQLERNVDLFKTFAGLLLDIVSHVNVNTDRHVRGCACDCLHELELAYPGVLTKKLEHFYQMARLENTTAFQSYLLLFIRTLLHAAYWVVQQRDIEDHSRLLSELLTKRTEPLKPLSMADSFSPVPLVSKADSGVPKVKVTKQSEVAAALKYMLDCGLLLTAAAQASLTVIMGSLCDVLVLSACGDLQESVMAWHQRGSRCYDVQLLGAAQCSRFEALPDGQGDSLPRGSELCMTLCTIISNPASRLAECQLSCDLLAAHLPTSWGKAVPSPTAVPAASKDTVVGVLRAAMPMPFDCWELQIKKLLTLSKLMKGGMFSGVRSAWLVGTLRSLRKQWWQELSSTQSIAIPEAIFFVLLRFLVDHGDGDQEFVHDVQQSLYSIIAESPEFTHCALWLIACLRSVKPGSLLPQRVLDDLVDLACSLSVDTLSTCLPHYAPMLCHGVVSTTLPRIRTLLQKLTELFLMTSMAAEGSWRRGNELLDICRSCLCRDDCKSAYVELGELLYTAATEHGHIDVRERATLYYSMLVNLHAQKIRDVLEDKEGLSRRRPGKNYDCGVSFPIASAVMRIRNIFSLEKIGREVNWPPSAAISTEDAAAYNAYLMEGNHPTISLHCKLALCANETTTEAFAIVVSLASSASAVVAPIKDVMIDFLDMDGGSSKDFTVNLALTASEPFALDKLSATFSCGRGLAYSTSLKPIQLTVADLACNMPVRSVRFFDSLWSILASKLLSSGADAAVLSMTHFDDGAEYAKTLFSSEGRLHVYAVESPSDAVLQAAFFFHPSHHVLMKTTFLEGDANAELLASDFHVLNMVNQLLKSCFAERVQPRSV